MKKKAKNNTTIDFSQFNGRPIKEGYIVKCTGVDKDGTPWLERRMLDTLDETLTFINDCRQKFDVQAAGFCHTQYKEALLS